MKMGLTCDGLGPCARADPRMAEKAAGASPGCDHRLEVVSFSGWETPDPRLSAETAHPVSDQSHA